MNFTRNQAEGRQSWSVERSSIRVHCTEKMKLATFLGTGRRANDTAAIADALNELFIRC